MTPTGTVAGRLGLATVAGAVLAGCTVVAPSVGPTAVPTPDQLVEWSDTPLAPDVNLAKLALMPQGSCLGDAATGQILVQDRRTPQTAGFLVAGPTVWSCIITPGGGSGRNWEVLEPLSGLLSLDDNGDAFVDALHIRMAGGRVAPAVARVVVHLGGGSRDQALVASVGNGYWLAWWPINGVVTRVVATDSAGAEIAVLEVPT